MALEPANVPISFAQGLDTKTDDKQLIVGKMEVLKNASFVSPKQIKKRPGTTAFTRSTLAGGTISAGVGVAAFKNELNILDGQTFYSYAPDPAKQVSQGSLRPVTLSIQPVVRNTYQQTQPDSCYNATYGIQVFVWIDSSNGVRYSVFDTVSKTVLVNNASVSTTATKAKVVPVSDYFIIIYYDTTGTKLAYKYVYAPAPTVLSVAATINTDINTTYQCFDATVINSKIYLVYGKGTTDLAFYTISTAALVLSSQSTVSIGDTVRNGITICGDSSFNAWCAFSLVGTPSTLCAVVVNSTLASTVLTKTTVDSSINATGFNQYNITMAIYSGTTTAYIYYEQTAAPDNFIKVNTLTLAGVAGTPAVAVRGMGLASKAWIGSTDQLIYFLTTYGGGYIANGSGTLVGTTIEPTYFLYQNGIGVVGKLAPSSGGGYYTTGLLPEVTAVSSTQYQIPYLIQGSLSSLNGNVFFKTGVMMSTWNFTPTYAPQKLSLADNLHVASGQLWMYDGANVVEHGFHLYPENVSQSAARTGGGIGTGDVQATPINQVSYIALYEWSDNQGQIHRSATSPSITATLLTTALPISFTATIPAGGGGVVLTGVSAFTGLIVGQVLQCTTTPTAVPTGTYITQLDQTNSKIYLSANMDDAASGAKTFKTYDQATVSVTVPTLRATLKSNVSVALYRTAVNGSVFYRTSSLTSLTYSSTSTDSVTFSDTTPDAVLIGNEQLYTTGGEISNIAAPAVSALTKFKNRAIYLSPENPYQWGYSKQAITGSPVEFNSLEFVQNIDQGIGQITAAVPMDDKLIFFGPTSKYYVVGDGPTPAGTNNDFSAGTAIAGSTGCSNPASIVEIPAGLMYQDAQKGIYLLGRALDETYIGADVESYNSLTVTSASKIPNSTKVIFTYSSGSAIVYDYFVNQWETDVYPSGIVDSAIYNNTWVYIQSNGLALKQDSTLWTDNTAVVPLSFKTGWMSFAGIEGFQRVRELQILGTYKSAHTLTVNIYTDYSTTASQTVTIPVTADPAPYQFGIKIVKQKCEAIQIEIIETQSPTYGEGLSLSSLAFRVGVKKGLKKLPASVSY